MIKKVKKHLMDESRSDVGPLTRPDVLAPIVDEAINGPYEFLEVVIETTGDNCNEGTAPPDGEPTSTNPVELAPPTAERPPPHNLVLQHDPEAVATMVTELSDARNTIEKQSGELAQLRMRCLRAENESASGKPPSFILGLFNHFHYSSWTAYLRNWRDCWSQGQCWVPKS